MTILKKLLPELQRSVRHAREKIAAEHLRSDKVRTLVHQAAEKGHSTLRIRLPDGIDVRNTDGAAIFLSWASDAGLTVDWESRPADLEGGRRAIGFDAEISWYPGKHQTSVKS